MPLVRERHIFMLAINALSHYGSITGEKELQKIHKLKIAESLALLCQTEDFTTYRNLHHNSGSDVEVMSLLKDRVLTDLAGTNMDHKKIIRPLVDAIDKAKRMARTK